MGRSGKAPRLGRGPRAGRITRMKSGAVLILCLAALLGSARDGASAVRGPSTPKERAKALKLIRQLEEDPDFEGSRDARRWLSLWLVEVPDLRADLCPELLGGTAAERRRIPGEVLGQLMYSGAAVLIENRKAGREEVYLAGVRGALRVYETLLAKRPQIRSAPLDALIGRRDSGTLGTHVTAATRAGRLRVRPSPGARSSGRAAPGRGGGCRIRPGCCAPRPPASRAGWGLSGRRRGRKGGSRRPPANRGAPGRRPSGHRARRSGRAGRARRARIPGSARGSGRGHGPAGPPGRSGPPRPAPERRPRKGPGCRAGRRAPGWRVRGSGGSRPPG
jgi:hypothetical protein